MSDAETISISFGRDEALVLFELAERLRKTATLLLGEREVLDQIDCALERELTELFRPNYADLVSQARARLVAD